MVFELIFLKVNAGPFAPVLGYVAALVSVASAIWALLWRNQELWQAPKDIIPAPLRGLLIFLISIGLVYLWLSIEPTSLTYYVSLTMNIAIAAVIAFLSYFAIIRIYRYDKVEVIPGGINETKKEKILGGLWLRSEARKIKRKKKLTTQKLFEGAAYDEDLLWSRVALELSKMLVVILYFFVVLSGTIGITGLGFVIQVKLTGKPASYIISEKDAPGLKNTDTRK